MLTYDTHTHTMAHILDGDGLHKSHMMEFEHTHDNGATPHHHLSEDTPNPENRKENNSKLPHWLDQL
jgi:hypothetical protein